MERFIKPSRLAFCAVVMAALLVLYSLTLYKIQVVEGARYVPDTVSVSSVTRTVTASRGSIFDRNGTLLASDRTVYNITINRDVLLHMDNPNDVIRTLLAAAARYGVTYNDEFPVTKTAPFAYDAGATSRQLTRLKAYFDFFKALDDGISASDFVSWLRDHYKISYTVPAEEARKIIGVRYGLEIRAIVNTDEYFFAKDVPAEFVNYIAEQSFACVNVTVESERQYHTTYGAHILGYTGAVEPEEYQNTYKDLGYPMDAIVGKTGAERAFESYLHGVDGRVTTWYDAEGAVTGVEVRQEASAGNNVYLTIDIGLTERAEKILASNIARINDQREQEALDAALEAGLTEPEPIEEAEGGAVVMLDVRTGEVIAMASYPTYDLANLRQTWSAISSDPLKPLWNRATYGPYNPGSTFKMVTALAGLREGVITRNTEIEDMGIYTQYPDYQPTCWIYPQSTHGKLNVVGALAQSCNYFFYYVSDQMDIDELAAAAREFGFGSPTGIELGESSGVLATREYKINVLHDTGWWKADSLITSIGQGLNRFTPIQLANYCAAIANGGTLYSATVLRYIASYDYSRTLVEQSPAVLNRIDNSDGYINILQDGMRAVVTSGTGRAAFRNYPVAVAAKTGTVQSAGTAINDGVFICYAPADDPEVAIAVVVEKGGSGSALAPIARELLDAYFATTQVRTDAAPDNTMVP